MTIGHEISSKKPQRINKLAPTELTALSVFNFFIKKDAATKTIARYPIHSIKAIPKNIINCIFLWGAMYKFNGSSTIPKQMYLTGVLYFSDKRKKG